MRFMKIIGSRTAALAVLTLLFGGPAKAQAPVVYRPGDTLNISVTFNGPDAGKVASARVQLQITKTIEGQEGFSTQIFPGASNAKGTSTFEVSFKIPENQASGDYSLAVVSANVDKDVPIWLVYEPSKDFPAMTFRVDNPKKFTKPTIKVKELPKT